MAVPDPFSSRRVVVTGLGLATSLGFEVEEVWRALIDGRSGIGFLEQFDSRGFPVRAGGEIKDLPPDSEAASQPNRTLRFAVWAARRAFQDAGLDAVRDGAFDRRRAGVVLGAGLFPVMEDRLGETAAEMFDGDGLSTANHLEACRNDPALLTQQSLGSVSGTLSSLLGLGGPSQTVQAACTSATQAIGEAWERIRRGRADVIVTGGADSMMSMFCVAGFDQLGALSRNPDPSAASRPFDGRRDGFVLGEGAGILVLEELEHARRRGARIHAEIVGYGSSSDAWRFTDIEPQARGAVDCLKAALRSAGLRPEDVDYVNAHGTATPQNDRLETLALRQAFGDHARRLAISSTKSQLGHLICAAGGLELLVTVLALQRGVLPPTLNLETPDPDCDLDYIPGEARRADARIGLSSSFGFGGQNAVVVAKRWEDA